MVLGLMLKGKPSTLRRNLRLAWSSDSSYNKKGKPGTNEDTSLRLKPKGKIKYLR